MASFVFESLNVNVKPRARPLLKENFRAIFSQLESNAKMETQSTGEYNFRKCEYTIPVSLNQSD